MKKLLIIIILCGAFFLYGNEAKIDSLLNVIPNLKAEEKVDALNQLAKIFWAYDPDETIKFGSEALTISKEIRYLKGEGLSNNNIGVAYYFLSDYESALKFFFEALEIRKELGDKKEIVSSLNNIGIVYDDLVQYESALDYYKQSLDIYASLNDKNGMAYTHHNIGVVYEKQSNYYNALEHFLKSYNYYEDMDDKQGIASAAGNIGIVFGNLTNYEKAIEYHLESLKLRVDLDDKYGISSSLVNLGEIYDYLSNFEKSLEYYERSMEIDRELGNTMGIAGTLNNIGVIYDDKKEYIQALEYYNQSLAHYEEVNGLSGMANAYNNIGVVYENLAEFRKALDFHLKAHEIFNKIGNQKGTAASMNNIGTVYLELNDFKKAHKFLNDGLTLAKEIETIDLVIEIYSRLSLLYEKQGDYEQSLRYYKMYNDVKDGIFAKERIETIAGMQTTYEVQNLINMQMQEIEILQKDNEIYKLQVDKQGLMQWRLYLVVIVLFIAAFVIFYLYRTKNQANRLLEKEVEERTHDLRVANSNLMREIGERKEIQKELIRSERMAGIGELAAGIAHEIRNPLGNISSSAQYCLNKYDPPEPLKKYMEIMREESRKANTIIKGLLDFANPHELKMELIPMCEVVQNVKERVHGVTSHNDVNLKIICPDYLPKARLDKNWFEQAVLNLVLNGIHASESGSELTMELVHNRRERELNLKIIDQGAGISEENQKKIFDPFFTTKEDGVGLGLSLVHQIIEDHNGKLIVKSKLGEGTCFTIILPLDK